MSWPRVSVVMSAYSPQFVRAALDSILAQTFTEFEFVIVDDSVSEDMGRLLADYAARDPRIVLERNERNQGQTWSLNRGLALARGALIARQDDDDISDPRRLERQVAFLAEAPDVGLLGTQATIIDTDGRALRQTTFPTAPAEVQATLLRNCCLCHGSVMLRRQWLPAVGHFDSSLQPAEDYDLWLRLAEVTQVANLAEPLYAFRLHTGSQSFRRRHTQMFNKAQALERALARRYGAQPPAALRAPAARDYLEALVAGVLNRKTELPSRSLERALALAPMLLDQDEPLQSILNDYTAAGEVDEAVDLVEGVFAALPKTPARLVHQQSRYMSGLYMRAVFRDLGRHRPAQIRRNLWRGLRHDPRWLLNRGVLATCLRSLTGRL